MSAPDVPPLVAAFHALRSPRREEQNAAVDLIHAELRRMAATERAPHEDREDAIQQCLYRLIFARSRPPADIDSEPRVKAYLRRALRNQLNDERRRERRLVALEQTHEVKDPAPLELALAQGLLVRGVEIRDGDLAREAAGRTLSPRRFLDDLERLRRFATGQVTMRELVQAECASRGELPDGPGVRRRTENRIAQAFFRVRTGLERCADEWLAEGRLDPPTNAAVRMAIGELRARTNE